MSELSDDMMAIDERERGGLDKWCHLMTCYNSYYVFLVVMFLLVFAF